MNARRVMVDAVNNVITHQAAISKYLNIKYLLLRSSMAQWLRSLTLVRKVPGSIPSRAQKFVSNVACSITASDLQAGAG